jgi:hypothetical protein
MERAVAVKRGQTVIFDDLVCGHTGFQLIAPCLKQHFIDFRSISNTGLPSRVVLPQVVKSLEFPRSSAEHRLCRYDFDEPEGFFSGCRSLV